MCSCLARRLTRTLDATRVQGVTRGDGITWLPLAGQGETTHRCVWECVLREFGVDWGWMRLDLVESELAGGGGEAWVVVVECALTGAILTWAI